MGNPTITTKAIKNQIQHNRNAVRQQIALISAATHNESRLGYDFAHRQMTLRFDALQNRIAESHDHLARLIIRHCDDRTPVIEAQMPRQ